LFIYPNIGTGEIPLNLSYLSAILKKDGHEVKVFDVSTYKKYAVRGDSSQTKVGQFRQTKPRPDAEIKSKESDVELDLITLVATFKPDLIGITSFTYNFKLGIKLLEKIKTYFSTPTIYGGVHSTLVPESVISEPSVDMVCVGEGEGLIRDLANEIRDDYPNLWTKKRRNPLRPLIDLNELPFQDFDDYENYNFFRPLAGKLYKSASVEISRGCPYKCSYCVNHSFQSLYAGLGKYHRVKSVDRAIGNLVHLKNKYGIELMRFWDEDFTTLSLGYLKEFSKDYIRKVGLPFLIYARVDTITKEKAEILKEMGCITIAMGIESGSEEIRRHILNRNMTDDKIIQAFNDVRKAGIRCSSYNMIGLPFEKRRDIFKTIKLNRICKPDSCSVAFLEPYPNTEIFKTCVNSGHLDSGYIATFDFFNPHIKELYITHKELRGLLRTFILYVKAPKILYPLVRLCERGNDWLYKMLLKIFKGG
jgi:radical SAM superfamily enzyme YgiQ (UPF0313 family)